MTSDQFLVFTVLGAALVLFVWDRWRYDVVALMALLVVAGAGLVEPERVFSGFGHPAVVTVAAVLVISRGLMNAGVVDALGRQLARVGSSPTAQVGVLTALVALLSGFMNNVGALALLMPVAILLSRRSGNPPSLLLMPLAFGSLLGGMLTMVGTPPNIIVASYRTHAGGEPFRIFDFLPVGAGVTLAGVLFVALVGWRLTPRRLTRPQADELFQVGHYLTELCVGGKSRFVGRTLHDLVAAMEKEVEVVVLGLHREKRLERAPSMFEVLHPGDILLVQASSDDLGRLTDLTGFELAEDVGRDNGARDRRAPGKEGDIDVRDPDLRDLDPRDLDLREVVVTADSPLVGTTATVLLLREQHGVNVLAVARQGQRLRQRVGRIRFAAGDILLVQGHEETLDAALSRLGCLPLAVRELRLGQPRRILLATGIFMVALALAALGVAAAATALAGAALAMVLTGLLSPGEAYRSIGLDIIVLLAAMIPLGEALETTGGAHLVAGWLAGIAQSASPAGILALLMVATMLLSNVVNNAAAAILVSPIAVDLAAGLGASADPFLMAVAIGASSAFLTPIGHQSNTLVMTPGGYSFGDYWRMGLPLSAVVVATAVPLIAWVWGN